jgi:hypothetical protein
MAEKRRQGRERGPEREGSGVSKSAGDESKTSRTETKNDRRRREKEELLRQNERHEGETYLSENSQRPKLPD